MPKTTRPQISDKLRRKFISLIPYATQHCHQPVPGIATRFSNLHLLIIQWTRCNTTGVHDDIVLNLVQTFCVHRCIHISQTINRSCSDVRKSWRRPRCRCWPPHRSNSCPSQLSIAEKHLHKTISAPNSVAGAQHVEELLKLLKNMHDR